MNNRKLSLKWFGSLSNLSTRRSSDKSLTSPKHAPVQDGSQLVEGDWSTEVTPRPLGPCYARSSDMYTHVGTVPRSDKDSKKKLSFKRSTKATKKKEKQEVRLMLSVEKVMDSPLLGVLQTLNTPSPVAVPSLPLTSALSPLTCGVLKTDEKSTGSEQVLKSGESKDVSRSQDLYVHMDPINEAQMKGQIQQNGSTQQNKQEAETRHSEKDLTDGNGEYVKFSKEKPCLDLSEKQIQEDELKLQSVACYHGPLPPELCETLLLSAGDFLLRDSTSSHGDLVLSGHCGRGVLHFLVQVQQCEGQGLFSVSGRSFHSLPELIHFYTSNRVSLSQGREVYLQRPVDRTFPLSHSQTRFNTMYTCPDSPSTLHREAEVNRDNPLMSAIDSPVRLSSTICSIPQALSPGCSQSNSFSPLPIECSDANEPLTAPIPHNNLALNQDQDLDQDSSGYTELYPQSFVDRLAVEEKSIEQLTAKGDTWFCPAIETTSCFSPSLYRSALMPRENKPLEVNILRRVKEILVAIDPKMAAKHMTKADCLVGRILEVSPEVQRMMGVSSGMELLTLPHGQQLRLDLLERFETMAITLAVHVLGCTGTCEERAALIDKLILIAAELKNGLGNMFGFAVVMRALQLPQVSRLEQTWATLRQRHTESAVLFEKTLRPFMKSLNDGRESCALSSTSFPHILPLLCLLERGALGPGLSMGEGPESWDTELGVDVVMFHLSAARTIAQLGNIYRSNAHSKLKDLEEQVDISELFQTDFQLRLLWGSRGAGEKQSLRYNKFNQVLTALSNKLEPPKRTR